MPKRVTATEAKNNFGGLLEDVAVLGRVDIMRHGRLVAVVLSPREGAGDSELAKTARRARSEPTHMIPRGLARAARVRPPPTFDDD